MSHTTRKIERHLRQSNPNEITGLDEHKIKEVIGTISFRQGQVWQNERDI